MILHALRAYVLLTEEDSDINYSAHLTGLCFANGAAVVQPGASFRSYILILFFFFFFFASQVVLGGVIEIVVQHYTDYSFGISVLRSVRLLRIFKFTR